MCIEHGGKKAVQQSLPCPCQLASLTTAVYVLEDLGHHAVQLFCCLVNLHKCCPLEDFLERDPV